MVEYKHTTVSLPRKFHAKIKKIIEGNPELGYTSVAEFCKDAVRKKIEEMENRKILK
ncbi:MAG: ribbon-helix-helix domain-containing protein [Candidatus Thermoplasmatota archaeon]|nr:ribbon-helix-helix domain-containing protein [Candidatus Thermoplasmatota archaeon]